jgi:hypothetical protein
LSTERERTKNECSSLSMKVALGNKIRMREEWEEGLFEKKKYKDEM